MKTAPTATERVMLDFSDHGLADSRSWPIMLTAVALFRVKAPYEIRSMAVRS